MIVILTHAVRTTAWWRLDKKTGEPVFSSQRKDLVAFATNTKDSTLYAATKDGRVLAFKAVTVPGVIGEVVRARPLRSRSRWQHGSCRLLTQGWLGIEDGSV